MRAERGEQTCTPPTRAAQCCVDEPAKYSPCTSGQHLLERYAATHAGYSAKMAEGVAKV